MGHDVSLFVHISLFSNPLRKRSVTRAIPNLIWQE